MLIDFVSGCGFFGFLILVVVKVYGVCKVCMFDIEKFWIDFVVFYGVDVGYVFLKKEEGKDLFEFV